MRITRLETLAVGDGQIVDPNLGGVEPLAILRVHTDQGLVGTAEAFRVPPGAVAATVGGPDSHFGRLLIGQELTHPERLWQRMWDSMMHSNRRGWQVIIMGALDIALWDLYGQAQGQPVWRLLGGAERGPFQTPARSKPEAVPYATIVSQEWDSQAMIDQQVALAERACGLGFRAVKVEPLMCQPALMVEMARRVRKAIGPQRTLMVDVGYFFHDVPTALRTAQAMAEHDVAFLETPFAVDRPEPYAELAARAPMPLAMGEHAVTRWELLDMMERGGVRVVQPYMATCGGLTEAKRIVEAARARGAQVIPGNWSTQLLGAASVHLALWSPVTPFIEYAPAELYASDLRRVLQAPGFPMVDGAIAPPETPGIGYRLPIEEIARWKM